MQLQNKNMEIFDASDKSVGIVVSRFNGDITEKLLNSAEETLKNFKVKNYEVISVAGGIEAPLALQRLAMRKSFDALVVLSCIIQGETPHFDYVAKILQEGVLKVSMDHNIPIGFGVLTLLKKDQAENRLHIGSEAVAAALDSSRIK